MAERRMLAKKITESDAFLELPLSSQCLYFHLNMSADDDGFVNSPMKIKRMIGASDDDMKLLIMKKFILTFESGIIVIKHWKIHNYIQSDRYKQTDYLEEKSLLSMKQTKEYMFNENIPENKGITDKKGTNTECIQNVSVGKVRLGKDSIDKKNMCISNTDALFENIWKLYPNKRGKGKVSVADKRRLIDIGYDELKRAIARYNADLAIETWKKPQNGSTFFHSGYIDYLDANYTPIEKDAEKQGSNNKFTNFNQRHYDTDALENMLLNSKPNNT